MKLYIGNLPFTATENLIKETFSQYGNVSYVKMISDRETGRFRGFAFIEIDNGPAAIQHLNGANVGGRKITVNEAIERQVFRNKT